MAPHTHLMHPGANRTEESIKQHLYWPGLQDNCKALTKTCLTCQLSKKQQRKCGHLPVKAAETSPWETPCVDLIGPHKMRRKGKHEPDLELKAVTMIDPATGWFETCTCDDKRAMTVANLVETTWLLTLVNYLSRLTQVVYWSRYKQVQQYKNNLIKDTRFNVFNRN